MPQISVIVPVYKVEPYLDTCVRSIAEQSFRDIEILLVDDGSPDACPALCDAWAAKDGRIRVIHRLNGGLSAARNSGIDAASAPWLFFVDSDDSLLPGALQSVWDAQKATGAPLVVCNLCHVEESGRPVPGVDFSGMQDEVLDQAAFWQRYETKDAERIYYSVAWNKLYKAELFDRCRYRPGKRYEDQFILPELIDQCDRIACLAAVGYRYLRRAGSIMGEGSSMNYLDRPEYLLEWAGYFAQKGRLKKAEGLLNDAVLNLSEKHRFKLEEPSRRRRWREAKSAAARLYRDLAKRTGSRGMLLRAALIALDPGLYIRFLRSRSPEMARRYAPLP